MSSSTRKVAIGSSLLLALALTFALTRGHGRRVASPSPTPTPSAPAAIAPAPPPPAQPGKPRHTSEPKLALALDEREPVLLSAPNTGAVPAAFQAARAALNALHPRYLRIIVNWAKIQPLASRAADLASGEDGCARSSLCAPSNGLLAELQAVRSRQQAGERVDPVLLLAYAPAWAVTGPGGCERPGAGPASRPLNQRGLSAYQALIKRILLLGRKIGMALPYWSPWNEPNHPIFMTQRQRCQSSAPAISPLSYSRLVVAMQRALADSPHRLIIGELAGYQSSSPTQTSVAEFIASLPSALICQGSIFAVHDYFGERKRSLASSTAAVSSAESALARKGACGSQIAIWVTESGSGATRRTAQTTAARERGCRRFAAALVQWYGDPRVRAVFQYTFREDPLFPIGLYSNSLAERFPSYSLLASWARNPRRPPSPGACQT